MKLATALILSNLTAGGPGSGCHGPVCGRPKGSYETGEWIKDHPFLHKNVSYQPNPGMKHEDREIVGIRRSYIPHKYDLMLRKHDAGTHRDTIVPVNDPGIDTEHSFERKFKDPNPLWRDKQSLGDWEKGGVKDTNPDKDVNVDYMRVR